MIVRISDDAAAVACGADAVAAEFARRGATVERVSSWGMHWLEPLVEIDGVGFGPIGVGDVERLFSLSPSGERAGERGISAGDTAYGRAPLPDPLPASGERENLCIGTIAEHPFIAAQQRLTFARAGKTRPLSLEDYAATDGWKGLNNARALTAEAIVDRVKASGLRGRGGAGFPAGIKWDTVRLAPGPRKYIVCNADEGDSGTFADRMLMEGDPFCLIEGMAIAALATGAQKGFVYIRSEYPHAIRKMQAAARLAAPHIAPFEIEIRVGAGAYVCGEETSLLNSLEGKRGEVRAKPPLPAHEGLFGCPTVINNVLTLAAVPFVLAEGAQAYADCGFGRSRGTMPVQLAGNIRHGGLFEIGFGITLGELVNEIGGGTASGRPVKAVQVGGPLGAYIHPDRFDLPFDYEAFTAADALIGHGGITVFDDSADMLAQARFAMDFCAIESCGKCTPCRIGAVRGRETLDRIRAGGRSGQALEALPQMHNARSVDRGIDDEVVLLTDLCETMQYGSLCALGGFTPFPVMSALKNWPEDFGIRAPALQES